MSLVYFISDLHLGHKNVLKFEPGSRVGTNVDEHDRWLVDQWNSVVKPRDTVWVLGDVCMDEEKVHYLDEMRGQKHLIIGNHDNLDLSVYQKYFYKIHAMMKYKGFWVTHCPMHPSELWGRKNIHGHIHSAVIEDENYINVCVERSYGKPQLFTDLIEKFGRKYVKYPHE
ncbi:MAG: hypothetical protein GY810_01020 [Aureispira sp.]|nr:hypothetical protein [Aureispira sp.]